MMTHAWNQRLGFWWIAEDHPDQPAVVESPTGPALTFGELAGRAHQLGHALRAKGLGDNDIVAYALPNDLDVLVWQLAAQQSGLQFISLSPALSAAEISSIVEYSGASALVLHDRFSD